MGGCAWVAQTGLLDVQAPKPSTTESPPLSLHCDGVHQTV